MALAAPIRRSSVRRLGHIGLALVVCYVALALYVQASERLMRHRAERLLEVMRHLQAGESTWADLQGIMAQWGAWGNYDGSCTEEHCDYQITLSDIAGGPRFAILASGLGHGHSTSAFLRVTLQQGIVKRTSFSLWVQVPKGYGTRWERQEPQDPGYVPYSSGEYTLMARASSLLELSRLCCYWPQPVPHPNYDVRKPDGCEGCLSIWTDFLPQTSQADRLRLTAINFDCVTRWRPCADEEDIMPGVGVEYQQERRARLIESGRQEQCAYSVTELSGSALNAAVARVISMPDEGSDGSGLVRLGLVRRLAGIDNVDSNETIGFGVPTEGKQHKLVSAAFTDRKQLIVLYWRDRQDKTLQVYTCALLQDNEQIEKYVTAGVGLGRGLPEYE